MPVHYCRSSVRKLGSSEMICIKKEAIAVLKHIHKKKKVFGKEKSTIYFVLL